jgi:hypothetical protein
VGVADGSLDMHTHLQINLYGPIVPPALYMPSLFTLELGDRLSRNTEQKHTLATMVLLAEVGRAEGGGSTVLCLTGT